MISINLAIFGPSELDIKSCPTNDDMTTGYMLQNRWKFSVVLALVHGSAAAATNASALHTAGHPWLGTLYHGKANGSAH